MKSFLWATGLVFAATYTAASTVTLECPNTIDTIVETSTIAYSVNKDGDRTPMADVTIVYWDNDWIEITSEGNFSLRCGANTSAYVGAEKEPVTVYAPTYMKHAWW